MITANELMQMVQDVCDEMVEHGSKPHDIVLDDVCKEVLARGGALILNQKTLFGLNLKFQNLPDGVLFMVS